MEATKLWLSLFIAKYGTSGKSGLTFKINLLQLFAPKNQYQKV